MVAEVFAIADANQDASNPTFAQLNDGEKLKIRELLHKKQKYSAEHDILKKQIADVEYKMTAVQAEYGTIYNSRSQLLALPIEVTCLIFEHAYYSEVEEPREDEKLLLLEIVVTHVCSKWRTVALGYPKLWFSFSHIAAEGRRAPIERFEAYMERIASQPFELWLDLRCPTGASNEKGRTELLQAVFGRVALWKRITIFADEETALVPLLTNLKDVSAPFLEHLAISPDVDCECGDDAPVWAAGLDAAILTGGTPRLTSLHLDGATAVLCLTSLSNLTDLRIEERTVDTKHHFTLAMLATILTLPNLTSLSLYGGSLFLKGSDDETLTDPIIMPNLKYLRIGKDEQDVISAFPVLRGPVLEVLILKDLWIPAGFNSEYSTSTTEATPYSFPNLREFWLAEVTAEAGAIDYLLKMTANITDLVISCDSSSDSIPQYLIDTPDESLKTGFWPRLKTFTANIEGETDAEMYIEFAKLRPKKMRSLKFRLHTYLVESWMAEDKERLEKLCEVEAVEGGEYCELVQFIWPPDFDYSNSYIVDDAEEDPFHFTLYYE